MAETKIPHLHNQAGLSEIRVHAHEFMCIGAKPPYDHPHIFLDMGSDHDIICPYCSTHYRFDPTLKLGAALPVEALWVET